MDKYLILYNPKSHRDAGLRDAKKLEAFYPGASFSYDDITKITDPASFIRETPKDVKIVFTGGDGTLSRTVNALYGMELDRDIYYYGAGSGNDFLRDVKKKPSDPPFSINEYMKGLPTVKVNGITARFINAIGLGLDGYCCEVSDRLHEKGKSKSYGMIAFEGVLGKFKPSDASVTVDGVKKNYTGVWMAPTMFGSYYGGGFNMAPEQSRHNPKHDVTAIVIHDVSRLYGIFAFLQIKKGLGKKFPKFVEYITGRHVVVEFKDPCALQIDGETVRDVTRYEVLAED